MWGSDLYSCTGSALLAQGSAVTSLKFPNNIERGALQFRFSLDPTNYAAGPVCRPGGPRTTEKQASNILYNVWSSSLKQSKYHAEKSKSCSLKDRKKKGFMPIYLTGFFNYQWSCPLYTGREEKTKLGQG